MDPSVWVYYTLENMSWISQTSEEEAQNKADLQFSHIYFFAELEELTPAA